MKNEIRTLRKCQKVMAENQYPGYPFQLSIVIDLEEKAGYIDYHGKKLKLEALLKEVNNMLIYQCLGADNTSKQTWIIDQHLEQHEEYLKYDYKDFYVDNLNAWRLYFALNAAIFGHKKTDKGFIFACIDEDCDYVDVKIFHNQEETTQFYNDYFKGE